MHKNHLEPVPSLPPIPNSKFIKKFGRSHKEQDKLPVNQSNTSYAPKEPIENDPHLFDLLLNDSLHFIHYGKTDSTVTSATVEKLVEKLTREMNYDFLMDFFLTFRQYLTPIKLCKLLISRFRWTLLEETDERQLIRIRYS
ncbi:hypothetical protein RMCBS344292_12501 [Rhizopus microsporus]|nr:hypothetical protein RMCBS344292_12501 [Rhizopus microsporus]